MDWQELLRYAGHMAEVENVVAVVSDIKNNTSRIFPGRFGVALGLEGYSHESSIWEKSILELMTEAEREEKYLAELRFFHFLRRRPRKTRSNYYLASKLRVRNFRGETMVVLHRMFYIHSDDSVRYALCLYGSMPFGFSGKSVVVNSMTGITEELTTESSLSILGKRELQVLKLVDAGRTSVEIAEILSISKNTVSRHRQEILSKLQVKNSLEACRIAKAMHLL